MYKSSLQCQNGLRISGSFLQGSGKPSNICWISSWSVLSCFVAFWMDSTCILDRCGVSSWMVTSKPLISVFSFGLTLLSASPIGLSLPGTCMMTKSYGCILSNNLCNLGGASLWCFRCMSSRGLWSLAYELSAIKLVMKLHAGKTTANISHFVIAYLVSAGLSFWMQIQLVYCYLGCPSAWVQLPFIPLMHLLVVSLVWLWWSTVGTQHCWLCFSVPEIISHGYLSIEEEQPSSGVFWDWMLDQTWKELNWLK